MRTLPVIASCALRLRARVRDQKDIDLNQFEALGLSPNVLYSIEALGYDAPTPIQVKAIPPVLAGHDLMGLAQTGTGKTAAFGLPIVQLLLDEKTRAEPRCARALILAPTRELANQIGDNMRSFVKRTPLRIVTVVGGASINTQIRNLEKGADILIATPGRLLDLSERRAVRIDSARLLVLDEADQMLDLGFIHALRKIASMVGTPRQTLLFSATMPKAIEQLSRTFLTNPVRVETAISGKTVDTVTQSVYFVPQAQKSAVLKDLLLRDPAHLSLVFARTKHGTEKLLKNLVSAGIDAVSIHGNKSQSQRERAIREFRDGEARVLVATDVAARGIDIPGVTHVYNHDLPEVPESYVHRIGRTARAGASGEAVSLCAPDESHLLRAIQKLTGIAIERMNAAAAQPAGENAAPGENQERHEKQRDGRFEGQRNGNRNGANNAQRIGYRQRTAHAERTPHPALHGKPREALHDAKSTAGRAGPNEDNRNQGNGERRTSYAARTPGAGEAAFTGKRNNRNGANCHAPEAGKPAGRDGKRKFSGHSAGPEREGEQTRRRGGKPFGSKPSHGREANAAVKFGSPSGRHNANAPANTDGRAAAVKQAAGKPAGFGKGNARQGDARPSRGNQKPNRRPGRAAAL